jgi:predicted transport protein
MLDKFCRELGPTSVEKRYLKKYVSYAHGKNIFCCVHLQKSGLRIWLKLNYSRLENPPDYVRDVSNIGHWGTGDVEVRIDTLQKLETSTPFIRQSFEENKQTHRQPS